MGGHHNSFMPCQEYLEYSYKFAREFNFDPNRSFHGLAIYIKDTIEFLDYSYSSKHLEFTFINTTNLVSGMQIVMLYKSPSMTPNDFFEAIEEHLIPCLNQKVPLIILGDFNFHVEKYPTVVQNLCKLFGCKMLIGKPTTDNLSILYLISSNTDGETVMVETYWSDHKIVYFHT